MSTSENSDGSGTETASERIEKKSKIPLILDGRFYAIQPEKADCMKPNVSAKCLTCNAIIKGSYRATSNFLLHIRTAHDGLEREWCEYKDSIQNSTKKRERIETTDSKVTKKRSPQKKADHLVMRYIFRAGRPLVTVDDDDFKNLVEGLSKLNEPVHCLSRKTLTKRIQKGSEEMDEDMRKELAAASYVCTTADIWSSFRRSFLGVTVHWVDPHTLTRKSAVLACKRFKENLWKLQKGTLTMFLGEVLGTGILIFIGCMGGIGTLGRTPPPPMQSAFTFGLTVNMIIMMLGHISGAHLNPAVTIGSIIIGLKTIPTGLMYFAAQIIGALIGYGLLKIVTPAAMFNDGYADSNVPLCVTVIHPEVSKVQAVIVEILCTAIVLCTACATWDSRCANTSDSVAVKFGLAIAGLSFAASPYTGCSMNPARTFAPALWNNAWKDQWVYWVGPVLGALLGTYTYQVLFTPSKEEYNPESDKEMEFSVIHQKIDTVDTS